MAKEILINQVFAGKYLEEGENIGHEVINFFRDDDGYNNLYITPSGRVTNHELEYILFVRNVSGSARKTVEVIALAKNVYSISKEEEDKIRYAGVSLNQIFSKNKYHGDADPFLDHISFRAGDFHLPAKRIFISIDDAFDSPDSVVLHLKSEQQVIIPQKMRKYYSAESDTEAYKQLKEFINSVGHWEEKNTTEKLIPDGAAYNQTPSFLEVIRKENDENIFSNLMAYFFEYSHASFQKFAKNVLKIQDMSATFTLYRETKYRVDLWIESEKDIIVIENKIKSGINGITDGKDYSQLNKYYGNAKLEAEKGGKKAHYYIFSPDYATFDLARFGLEGIFTVVKYSKLLDFFTKESSVYISDHSFSDFVRGLKRHTLTLPELRFETMRSRLLKTISQ